MLRARVTLLVVAAKASLTVTASAALTTVPSWLTRAMAMLWVPVPGNAPVISPRVAGP